MGDQESSGDFVAGFFIGALVGAALALIFAPASGDEVRSQIRDKSIELRGRVEELGTEAGKRADELKARGQTVLQEQKTRFQEAIEEGKRAAARKKEELLAQLEAARSSDSSVELTENKA
jgi:gas vesicle protein